MVESERRQRNRSRSRNSKAAAGVFSIQKRLLVAFVIILASFTALTFRIGWIQIVAADQYATKATEYQIKDERITPTRGAILDRNMNELAVSTVSYRVWVRLTPATEAEAALQDPAKLETQKQSAAALVAAQTGESAENILAKLDTDQPLVRIASGLAKPQIEAIREGINDEDITILEIEEQSTRKYPLGTLASKVIGSVNYDGLGQGGVEMQYNQYLSGIAGRKIARTDMAGDAITGGEKAFYESQDGLNVVTTIDESIQYYVEDALSRGLERTQADRMMAVVYDPKTGDVLAMADTDPYDPNDPGRPMSDEERAEFGAMGAEDQAAYLSKMWRNPCISDVYDPGSPFKTITVSSALEDGAVTPESWFNCAGALQVYDRNIRCWVYPGAHGGQTVREAVGNSCNPVMIQIVQTLGYDRFYNYLELFGITEKSGIDLPGEEGPLMQDAETAGPVGLATMAFGQGLSVTPIQMAGAIGAIANDGKLMVPRVVKGLADNDGNMVEEFAPKIKRQVISENTAAEVREIMNYVSEYQTAAAAKISGYNIGIKTGTTQKLVNGEYSESAAIGSMVIVAPIEDPQFVALVLCDTPRVGYYGIGTAGPVVNEIATELLRYLNIQPDYSEEEIAKLNSQKSEVADYTGWTLADAKASLERLGLKSNIGVFKSDAPQEGDGAAGEAGAGAAAPDTDTDTDGLDTGLDADENDFLINGLEKDLKVVDQYPKPGMRVQKDGTVFLYWE
ncbi:MAG: hypothetical protein LBS91_07645 [Clostridiales Family XIII bacterium]|jgi:stage V sporulation protein D (sporulation-specific penicillin-binding protein)|nr:hypothetical protein [Clostridiales Family XIII bacterium]